MSQVGAVGPGPVDALADAYAGLTDALQRCTPAELEGPCRLPGWTVGMLVAHLVADADRALAAFAEAVSDDERDTAISPVVDRVEYWRSFRPGRLSDGMRAAQREDLREGVEMLGGAVAMVDVWSSVASSVVEEAPVVSGTIRTQGLAMPVDEFLATLAVEATVHHLDLGVPVDAPSRPGPLGLALVRETLDGLLGEPAPPLWDDDEYALVGTGRRDLTDGERYVLGPAAERFPLLG